MCLAGASANPFPGALMRGGSFFFGNSPFAGVFSVGGNTPPSYALDDLGFRAAR
jgi:hypothetical protein